MTTLALDMKKEFEEFREEVTENNKKKAAVTWDDFVLLKKSLLEVNEKVI